MNIVHYKVVNNVRGDNSGGGTIFTITRYHIISIAKGLLFVIGAGILSQRHVCNADGRTLTVFSITFYWVGSARCTIKSLSAPLAGDSQGVA